MSFLCKLLAFFLIAANLPAAEQRLLRIAADPNNLPFSNDKLEGFENKIAELVAKELNAKIEYVWRAQRRGFFRETFKEGNCNLVMGVPWNFDPVLSTDPYYQSTYVAVSKKGKLPGLASLADERLKTARIGVHLVGDDGFNTPPVHALTELNIITNMVGFTIYGNYAESNPPSRIIDAVKNGEIDAAVVWGPFGGFFSRDQTSALVITPIPSPSPGDLPFTFKISMGVRKKDAELRDKLNEVIRRKKHEIQKILKDFHIPEIQLPEK